jgi:hypothetical protein
MLWILFSEFQNRQHRNAKIISSTGMIRSLRDVQQEEGTPAWLQGSGIQYSVYLWFEWMTLHWRPSIVSPITVTKCRHTDTPLVHIQLYFSRSHNNFTGRTAGERGSGQGHSPRSLEKCFVSLRC